MSFSEHGRGQPDSPSPEEQFYAVLFGEIAEKTELDKMEGLAQVLAESMPANITQETIIRAEATGAELCVVTTEYENYSGKLVSLSMGRSGNFTSVFELGFKYDSKQVGFPACNNLEEIEKSIDLIEEILATPQDNRARILAVHIQAYLQELKEAPKSTPDLYDDWGKVVTDTAQALIAETQGDRAVELREWGFGLEDLRSVKISMYTLRGYPENLDEPVPGETEKERQARKDMPCLEINASFDEERKAREYMLTQDGMQTLEVIEPSEDDYDPDQLMIVDDEVFDAEESGGIEVNPPRSPDVRAIIELLKDAKRAEDEGLDPFEEDLY